VNREWRIADRWSFFNLQGSNIRFQSLRLFVVDGFSSAQVQL